MMRFEENLAWLMIEPAAVEDHPDEVWVQYLDAKGKFHRLHIGRDLTINEHISSHTHKKAAAS